MEEDQIDSCCAAEVPMQPRLRAPGEPAIPATAQATAAAAISQSVASEEQAFAVIATLGTDEARAVLCSLLGSCDTVQDQIFALLTNVLQHRQQLEKTPEKTLAAAVQTAVEAVNQAAQIVMLPYQLEQAKEWLRSETTPPKKGAKEAERLVEQVLRVVQRNEPESSGRQCKKDESVRLRAMRNAHRCVCDLMVLYIKEECKVPTDRVEFVKRWEEAYPELRSSDGVTAKRALDEARSRILLAYHTENKKNGFPPNNAVETEKRGKPRTRRRRNRSRQRWHADEDGSSALVIHDEDTTGVFTRTPGESRRMDRSLSVSARQGEEAVGPSALRPEQDAEAPEQGKRHGSLSAQARDKKDIKQNVKDEKEYEEPPVHRVTLRGQTDEGEPSS